MIAENPRATARPPRNFVAFVGALCCAALATGGRPAAAATPEAQREARRSFESAEAHFRAGQFAEALVDYQAGYEASPLPGFLVNIAQCERRLGDLKKARATYQKFVIVAPDSPLVPQIKGLISELNRLLTELGDEKPPGSAAPPAAAEREPPADAPATARTLDLPAAPPPAATSDTLLVAAPAPTAEKPASRRRWWLWGGIGTVVACGAVTAFLLAPGASTVHDGSLGTLRR